MTTKAPSAVQEFPLDAIEKIAYTSVSAIPTEEPNDRNRLGYHVWRWLRDRNGTLEEAIAESGSRIHIPRAEVAKIVTEALKKAGVAVE